jgi:hypothetical protein
VTETLRRESPCPTPGTPDARRLPTAASDGRTTDSDGYDEARFDSLGGGRLRQQNPATPARPADVSGDGSVIHTLTESLLREWSANRERVNGLEKRLAAAQGENLRVRRQAAEHGLPD